SATPTSTSTAIPTPLPGSKTRFTWRRHDWATSLTSSPAPSPSKTTTCPSFTSAFPAPTSSTSTTATATSSITLPKTPWTNSAPKVSRSPEPLSSKPCASSKTATENRELKSEVSLFIPVWSGHSCPLLLTLICRQILMV